MTRDSGRHAQRGDVQQAPPKGCQSVIAQRIPTSPPIGTDEELIESVALAICEADCGRVTENELARCRELAAAALQANALQSRISEVERLELRAREALEGLLQIAAGVVEMGDPAYERACALFNELEVRAALSQHRKV